MRVRETKNGATTGARFLVVSLGSIGRRHLKNLRGLRPSAQIGVLRLSGASGGEPPPEATQLFHSLADALSFRPAAVIICSPATLHVEVASVFVRAGVPVFIEKPIADTSAGLRSLIDTAEKSRVPMMTGYNMRFLPSLQEAHRIIKSGAIGDVVGARAEVGQYLPDWRPERRYQDSVSARRATGGGALLELSHEIDYVYWMFGLPSRVTAVGGRFSALEIDVEDLVNLCLEYDDPRRLIEIHLDFLQRVPARTCKFIGTNGTLVWDGINGTLDLYLANKGEWIQVDTPAISDRNSMYVEELSHFLDCAESGKTPAISGRHGLDVLAIVEAAKESIERRIAIEVGAHGGD